MGNQNDNGGIRVRCVRRDCVYFRADSMGDPAFCTCHHPDKEYHLEQNPCPLYRLNWQRSKNQISLDDW